MGNCLKGCLSDDTNGGRRTRMNASDSHYEILIDGMQCTDGRREDESESQEATQGKASVKSKIFRKFWTRTKNVDYARLNKAKHNNFSQHRATATGANQSKHNQHPKSGFDIQLQCLDAHSLLLVSKDGHRKTNNNGYNDLHTDQTSTPGSSLDLEWENDYGYQNSQWLTQEDDPTGTTQLGSFPASVQESVFKIEEWSMLKRSKDRINALRRLDAPAPQQPLAGHSNPRFRTSPDDVAGSLECIREPDPGGRRRFPPAEHHASLSSVDRIAHGGSSDLSHISTTPDGSLEWDVDQDRQLKSENESLDYDTKELLLEIEQLKNRVLNETGATLKDTGPSNS